MAKSKRLKVSRGSASGLWENKQSTRPTHFLCFPLARDTTVPEAAMAMNHFKSISQDSARQLSNRNIADQLGKTDAAASEIDTKQCGKTAEKDEWPISDDQDPLGNISKPVEAGPSFEDSLKILPSIVYRGPGTLHLTLGVMNLSDPAEMEKAVNLLRGLDLRSMLKNASQGPPSGMKTARKWHAKSGEITGTVQAEVSNLPSTLLIPSVSDESTPLNISLTGLNAFPSTNKARVIWAKPRAQSQSSINVDKPSADDNEKIEQRPTYDSSEQERLYNFALHLHFTFKAAGLINETRTPVLHATIANMRYQTQAKDGRNSKSKAESHDRRRWEEGTVDARNLARVFNKFNGNIEAATNDMNTARRQISSAVEAPNSHGEELEDRQTDNENEGKEGNEGVQNEGEVEDRTAESEFIWCKNIAIDRVAICKMGATKSEDPIWVESYPPIIERLIFEDNPAQ